MRFFLNLLAIVVFVAPIVVWGFIVGMGCAFVTNNATDCGVGLNDYWDVEFLQIAVIPWIVAVALALWARRFPV